MARKSMPDRAYAREALRYNRQTGTLTWRKRPLSHFKNISGWKTWNTRFAGTPAGSYAKGYLMVVLDYRRYFAHRVIWLLVRGEPVPDLIDHKDHNPLNNQPRNLREATQGENGANAKTRKDSGTGVKGVGIWYGKYRARIRYDGRSHTIGCYATLAEAATARQEAAIRLHGAFARH